MKLEAAKEELGKLTIIILTRNRPKELRRILRYWGRWPVSILLLDGSDTPTTADQLDSRLAKLIVYADVDLSKRLEWAAHRISTPYACLHPDDDFILARSSACAISWLENHQRFTCIASDGQFFTETYDFYPSGQGRWILSEDPHLRLKEHFSDYNWSYVYGIHRSFSLSASLQANAAALSSADYLNHPHNSTFEFGMEIAGAVIGPLACGTDVMLLKAVGNAPPQYMESRWDTWLQDTRAQAALTAWILSLSKNLSLHASVQADSLSVWIEGALMHQMRSRGGKPQTAPFHYVSVLPVPKDFIQRLSFALRPKSHISSDQRVGIASRSLRKYHRLVFRGVRRIFRVLSTMWGKQIGKTPDSDWSWADPSDMDDFWTAIDGDYNSKN
jgi:hypothetical protein